ncbi:glycosyltransferase [Arthrobacter glacialis]|uniref:glycosyltransferase n=1 Tax=Arthrobacter glacialis TaxID=1664 RepID=UPI000CD3FB55|nr:glycosyltransferase family 2 protein [Arthrobacter glacialis]POH60667.1 glycosyl transferase [Arthrobacter glacialis]
MNTEKQQHIYVSILMVTYNSENLLELSLGPLIDMPDSEIIVVDNDSQDNTVSSLRKRFPSAKIITNSTNLGFGAAMNIAANEARGHKLLLLNPDAQVTAETVLELARRNDEIGGVSAPVILQPNGRLAIHSAGRFPTIWRMLLHFSGASRASSISKQLEGHYFIPRTNEPDRLPADWVTGAVLLIPRLTWKNIGGLTDRWFMYAEDIDLCWKVRASDEKVTLYSDLHASHYVGGSDSTESYSVNSDWVVNLHDFYRWRMNGSPLLSSVWCLVVSVGLFSRSVHYGIRSRKVRGIEGESWSVESRKFRIYAVDVLRSIRKSSNGQDRNE